jgi:hypothetical protein
MRIEDLTLAMPESFKTGQCPNPPKPGSARILQNRAMPESSRSLPPQASREAFQASREASRRREPGSREAGGFVCGFDAVEDSQGSLALGRIRLTLWRIRKGVYIGEDSQGSLAF